MYLNVCIYGYVAVFRIKSRALPMLVKDSTHFFLPFLLSFSFCPPPTPSLSASAS